MYVCLDKNFEAKIFAVWDKTSKSAKIFTLKKFWLYGMCLVIMCAYYCKESCTVNRVCPHNLVLQKRTVSTVTVLSRVFLSCIVDAEFSLHFTAFLNKPLEHIRCKQTIHVKRWRVMGQYIYQYTEEVATDRATGRGRNHLFHLWRLVY